MSKRLGSLVMLLLVWIIQLNVEAFQKTKLSQAQIDRLVTVGAPDEVIAQEIRARGLAFQPTQKTIEELRRRGAGQRALSAVRELIRSGGLEIQALPGSEIVVDGAPRGMIDAQGTLVLRDLPAGVHQIVVRKADYREGHFTAELRDQEYKRLPVQLEWAGGFLTIRAEPAGSVVDIDGVGQFNETVSDIKCSPRTYSITVTHQGMTTQHEDVKVEAGQHAVAEIRLNPDPEFLRDQVAKGEASLAAGDTSSAIQYASGTLALDSNNVGALSLMAAAYFQTQDLSHFISTSEQAIHRGGSVKVTLLHVHNSFAKKFLHGFSLTITANGIAYDPDHFSGSSCNIQTFTASLRSLQAVEVTRRNGTVLLRLKVNNPEAPKAKTLTLDFAAPGSKWDYPSGQIVLGPGGPPIQSPSNSTEILQAVADVVRDAGREVH